MTLILLERKVPMLWPLVKSTLQANWKCFRLSESEINSVFAAQ